MSSAVPRTADLRDDSPLILIVEDSRIQAAILRQILEKNGYEAVVAANGSQALELARQRRPAVVISDIVMPVMDGYATCCALKALEQTHDIPVILLTHLADPLDIVEGLQAGADYYLTKPYNVEYLLTTLATIVTQGASVKHVNNDLLEVTVQGHSYLIGAGRRQMLNLLLSTYSNAVLQNQVLVQTQSELRTVNAQLQAQAAQIEAQRRELHEMNEVLRIQAMRDSMTGLRNFRAFQERFAEEMKRSQRQAEPLSLLLLDVDNFKDFNDTYGHPAGDQVLQCFARVMESQARACDFVARYGGEEFVILLPNAAEDEARQFAERVRGAIESEPWPKRTVTASVGIATLSAATPNLESAALLAQADCALYAAKAAGRNRVSHIADVVMP